MRSVGSRLALGLAASSVLAVGCGPRLSGSQAEWCLKRRMADVMPEARSLGTYGAVVREVDAFVRDPRCAMRPTAHNVYGVCRTVWYEVGMKQTARVPASRKSRSWRSTSGGVPNS
jgi:hypothetical protein